MAGKGTGIKLNLLGWVSAVSSPMNGRQKFCFVGGESGGWLGRVVGRRKGQTTTSTQCDAELNLAKD